MVKPPSKEEREAAYKHRVTDVIAAMSPEERKMHSDRGAQVARETVAEWLALREVTKTH